MGNENTERVKRNRINRKWKLYRLQRGRCFYCGNKFRCEELTKDHVLRKRDGGTTANGNIVLACQPCNNYREATFDPAALADKLRRVILPDSTAIDFDYVP